MTYNPFGFNSSYLDMAQDLGDPRRQENCRRLPFGVKLLVLRTQKQTWPLQKNQPDECRVADAG